MSKVRVMVLRTAGTNCDGETAYAFSLAGAEPEFVHVNRLLHGERQLARYHILAIPGGFTYGDDVSAGKILANELFNRLREQLQSFVAAGGLVLGICNGFQVLVKAGLLPGGDGDVGQRATLFFNESGRFQCEWIRLRVVDNGHCVFTRGMDSVVEFPIAHGEGRFVADSAEIEGLFARGQVTFQYVDGDGIPLVMANPNGSVASIAGISDVTGRVLGLMPHPERHVHPSHHPQWTRRSFRGEGDGMALFRNAVRFAAT